jgi:exonuclease III
VSDLHGPATLKLPTAQLQPSSRSLTRPTSFTILSYNVCGINNPTRHTELRMFLARVTPSVLILQEPKVNHLRGRKPPSFAQYHMLHFTHPSRDTGIVMYIHHTCTFKPLYHIPHCTPYRPDHSTTVVGWVWVSSQFLPCPIVVGGAYLSHASIEDDVVAMTRCIRDAGISASRPNEESLPIFLLGDFNARHPRWSEGDSTRNGRGSWVNAHLLNQHDVDDHTHAALQLLNTRFSNTRRVPTHVSTSITHGRGSDSVLDLAMTSHPNMVSSMHILTDEFIRSDHMPIMLTLHAQVPVQTYTQLPTSHVRWRTKDVCWSLYAEYLNQSLPAWTQQHACNNTSTSVRLTQQEVDTCWDQLHNIIIDAAHACVGSSTISPESHHWWSSDPALPALHAEYRSACDHFRRLRYRCKDRAVQLRSLRVLATARLNAKQAKHAFNQAAAAAKRCADDEMVAAVDESSTTGCKPKLMWAQWKRTCPTTRIPLASFPDIHGAPPRNPQCALNNMAAHLASVSSSVGRAADTQRSKRQEAVVAAYLRNINPASPLYASTPFTHEQVTSACSSFHLNTALGSDKVSPYFVQFGGAALHSALFLMFSICSKHGLVPSAWRHGLVVALYKGDGDVNDPGNYRPICITSVVARMYERIHVAALTAAMTAVAIPAPSQFGFTRERSTHDAIFRLLSTVVDCMTSDTDPYTFVPSVFIDISKAYDKVWIDGLLYKLHHDLHITGSMYYMLRALLTERTMQAIHSNMTSDCHTVTAGVPQGSILAPFLFIIYIHGITDGMSSDTCTSLYADDIALCATVPGHAGLPMLQRSLDIMSEYAERWKLTFSAKKTKVVFFKPDSSDAHGSGIHTAPSHRLHLSRFRITTAPQYTYLGVVLDQRLSFSAYIDQVVKRSSVTSFLITRLCRPLRLPSFPVIRALVANVLIPQMTYGFAFLPSLPVTDSRMLRLKRLIIRPLQRNLLLPYNSHHASVFVESRLLDVPHLMTLAAVQLTHRWLSQPPTTANLAANMFRAYVRRHTAIDDSAFSAPTWQPSIHPFRRIVSSARRDGVFAFPLTLPSPFVERPKQQLRSALWEEQYSRWRMDTARSLPRCYPQTGPAVSVRDLPFYLMHDAASVASLRARLRFRRAHIACNRARMKYSDTDGVCVRCDLGVFETTGHFMCHCPNSQYTEARNECKAALSALRPPQSFSLPTLLWPCAPKHLLLAIHAITATYIAALHRIRRF